MRARAMLALLIVGVASAQERPPFADRIWLSAQANFLFQSYPSFRSPYSGPNSFPESGGYSATRVLTLYTGARLSNSTSVLVHVEQGSGRNINQSAGLAATANVDTVSAPDAKPYFARAMIHTVVNLGGGTVEMSRGPLQINATAPRRRLDLYAGKFSVQDFFDINAVGGDNHFQFNNGSINANATYGIPGNSRGYTYGAVVEYHHGWWAVRAAEILQPYADNPDRIDFNVSRSHAEHFELEMPTRLVAKQVGFVRVLYYLNHGLLGRFSDAIEAGEGTPDLEAVRRRGVKHGFGVNFEQELNPRLRIYGRAGWAEGKYESLLNTQANSAYSGGWDYEGGRWRRPDDRLGVAFANSGLSPDHRRFLALGGVGAVLGDGQLRYGRESAVEAYYTARLLPGIYATGGVQRFWNPGYNRDRGPVTVFAFRLHLEAAVFDQPH
jgi:hypothetical protein